MTGTDRWFTVTEPAPVVDVSGTELGKLRPGTRYRALGVDGSVVSLPGPNGSTGRVDLTAIDWETPEALTEPLPAAGWFPDPGAPTVRVRYWSGEQWTQHHAPVESIDQPRVEAGWYADPHAPVTHARYWDGDVWTEHQSQR